MVTRIAVVEDDLTLRGNLVRGLREEGFAIWLACGTGHELLLALQHEQPDVAVLDIGLPDTDGRDVMHAIRGRGLTLPVLMLTARGSLDDRLSGFHAGADDYLVKPFDFSELVVRLTALARRPKTDPVAGAPGRIAVDARRHAAVCAERLVELSPLEFRLLATLIAAEGTVVRRRALTLAAWNGGGRSTENSLDVHVARLRKKLDQLTDDEHIVTVRGVGYRLTW